jgi:hypothetical protein
LFAFSPAAPTQNEPTPVHSLHRFDDMKKHCIRLFETLCDAWRSLLKAAHRNHDPLLAQSMASFNFGGGWRELKISSRHMPCESSIGLVSEPSV